MRAIHAVLALALVATTVLVASASGRVAQVSSQDEPIDGSRYALYPSIAASAGGRELITWAAGTEDHANRRLWGRYVDESGRPDGAEFAIGPPSTEEDRVYAMDSDIAARGKRDEFLVVWEQTLEDEGYREELVARRYDTHGNALSEQFPVSPPGRFASAVAPAVAYDPSTRQFLVLWAGAISDGASEIYMSRIPAGTSRARRPLQVSSHGTTTDEIGAGAPSLAYDTNRKRYLIAWASRSSNPRIAAGFVHVRALRAGSRQQLGRIRRLSPGLVYRPDLAYSARADRYVVIWAATGVEEERLLALKLRPGGRPVGKRRLIADENWNASAPQVEPRQRGGYLLVFTSEDLDGYPTLYYQGISASLAPGEIAEVGSGDSRMSDLIYSHANSIFRVAWIQSPEYRPDPGYNPESPDQFPPPNVFVRSLSAKSVSP